LALTACPARFFANPEMAAVGGTTVIEIPVTVWFSPTVTNSEVPTTLNVEALEESIPMVHVPAVSPRSKLPFESVTAKKFGPLFVAITRMPDTGAPMLVTVPWICAFTAVSIKSTWIACPAEITMPA